GRVLLIPARRPCRRGGGGTRGRARERRARLPCKRRARARFGPVPPLGRGLRAAGGSRGRPNRYCARLCRPRMRIDVFTLVPHAFAWLTEQQPLAGILGTELELRLINYRETTPLRAGQVDDEPYGGGAGMDLTRAERRRLPRSEEHTSELQSRSDLVCRLLLEKKKK